MFIRTESTVHFSRRKKPTDDIGFRLAFDMNPDSDILHQ